MPYVKGDSIEIMMHQVRAVLQMKKLMVSCACIRGLMILP